MTSSSSDYLPPEQQPVLIRRRPAPAKQNAWQKLPISLKVGLPFIVLFVVGYQLRGFFGSLFREPVVTRVALVDGRDRPTDGKVEVFAVDQTMSGPSPLQKLGEVATKLGIADLPDKLVKGRVLVRLTCSGFGVDWMGVRPGETVRKVLSGTMRITGSVRDAKGQPIAAARVLALSEKRGVLLDEVASDAQGNFVLSGVSDKVEFVLLRVLKAGYAVAEESHWRKVRIPEAPRGQFELEPTKLIRGKLRLPEGAKVDFGKLQVRINMLPGVVGVVSPDGAFSIDHVPVEFSCQLLLKGLPAGYTHLAVRAKPGGKVASLQVVPAVTLEGRVYDRATGAGVPRAIVRHEHGSDAYVLVKTDGEGGFELKDLPVTAAGVRVFVSVPADPKTGFPGVRSFEDLNLTERVPDSLQIPIDY